MIVDAHCHVWRRWPYDPPVPDADTRAGIERLLHEMDQNEVGHAVIICAAIGDNPRNAEDAVEAAARHAGRFTVFPDVDCRWSPDFRRPGAARRLEAVVARFDPVGFTHYLSEAEDGAWLVSQEGLAFFDLAAERRLIASLSVLPHQVEAVIVLAERLPTLPILLHHFAFVGPRTAATPDALARVAAAARCPNVFVKYSGMGNVAAPDMEYPYPDLQPIPRRLAEAFGPDRMVWGSDDPVSRRHMTYRQSLSLLTRHGPFDGAARDAVLGGTMAALLARRTG